MSYNYNVEIADRCGFLLAQTRTNADISRKALGKKLLVSESTVKAWENGEGSPTFSKVIDWFSATGVSPFRPLLEFFWPKYFKTLSSSSTKKTIKESLSFYLREVAGKSEIRKLHYLIFSDYGGEWSGILDMFCAHAHTSLESRYKITEIINVSYELSLANIDKSQLPVISDNNIIPSTLIAAKTAFKENKGAYSITKLHNNLSSISARILRRSRLDAGLSTKYLAKAMGKTERTIISWEECIEPGFLEMCTWFYILGKPLWPYLRSELYPGEGIEFEEESKKLREELIHHFETTSIDELKKVCFLIFGKHGAYWHSMLELMIEHVCTPLFQRVISCRSVLISYDAEESHGLLQCQDDPLPNLDNLIRCLELGTQAAKNGEKEYHISKAE